MKKSIGALYILSLFLLTCASSKTSRPELFTIEYKDPVIEGRKHIDSLRTYGVNEIIGYYLGCRDCIPGNHLSYYVFWHFNDIWFATKFTKTNRYKTINGYGPNSKIDSTFINTLSNNKLNKSNIIMSGYSYEEVKILVQNKELNYVLKYDEKKDNKHNEKVKFTDAMYALIAIIPNEEWIAIDY
ncbi:MAG: hypothetical protein MI810_20285 [Flavobacteriales bacterium]|nr:hypothetical protein [Flavobacteriales bacterium]